MMLLEEMFELAAASNISVNYYPLSPIKSIAIQDDEECSVALDPALNETFAEQAVSLAHEIGHIATGSLYTFKTPLVCKSKHERRAWKWAVNSLIPRDKLESLLRVSSDDLWDAADQLDVTIDMVKQACRLYFGADV